MNRRHMLQATRAALGLAAASRADEKPPKPTPTGSFWEPQDRQMIDWLGVKTDHAGCGTGSHLGIFAEAGASVAGLDVKSTMINYPFPLWPAPVSHS